MDVWSQRERAWERIKTAFALVTPAGAWDTRTQAAAVLTETFARSKRTLQQPELLNYLDRVHQQVAALPFPEELQQAPVQQETWRRRPEWTQG